jgi:hypothetical protein
MLSVCCCQIWKSLTAHRPKGRKAVKRGPYFAFFKEVTKVLGGGDDPESVVLASIEVRKQTCSLCPSTSSLPLPLPPCLPVSLSPCLPAFLLVFPFCRAVAIPLDDPCAMRLSGGLGC